MSGQQYAVKNVSSMQSLCGSTNNIKTIVANDILTSVYMLGMHNLFCNDMGNPFDEFFEISNSNR